VPDADTTENRLPIRDIGTEPPPTRPASVVSPYAKNDIIITVGQKTTGEFSELFEQAIEEGNAARDQRNYVKAEGAYLRAQSLKTGDSRAVYGLGNLFADQQRWEEAERAYRTAIQMDPESPESYVALSYVLTQPIPVVNLADRYEEAEKIARRAIQLNSGNALAHDQLGVALELRGSIGDETENSYRKAIQLEGAFALAYAHLGRLLRKKGRIDESSSAYRNAIQLASDVPTMILVADVMQSQQRFQESEQLLRKALAQDPKNPTALILLGRALTTSKNFDEAEKVLKKSAEVSPQSFVSHTLLGSLYARQNKFESAEKALGQALRVVSANEMRRLAQEYEAVGDGYFRTGKSRDAARVYRQAMALDNEKASLPAKLAQAEGR
jgi:superkiller protein 3